MDQALMNYHDSLSFKQINSFYYCSPFAMLLVHKDLYNLKSNYNVVIHIL